MALAFQQLCQKRASGPCTENEDSHDFSKLYHNRGTSSGRGREIAELDWNEQAYTGKLTPILPAYGRDIPWRRGEASRKSRRGFGWKYPGLPRLQSDRRFGKEPTSRKCTITG